MALRNKEGIKPDINIFSKKIWTLQEGYGCVIDTDKVPSRE